MRRLSSLLSGLLLVAASCGSDSSGTSAPNSSANSLLNGTFSASINGTGWSAAGRVAVAHGVGNSLIIAAASTSYTITFTLFNAAAPGTYSLLYTNTTVPSFAILAGSNGSAWTTNTTGGGGTVVITALTSSRVAGSFSFDAPATVQTTATAHVTGGSFDVTY
jgi:hypothetical protein